MNKNLKWFFTSTPVSDERIEIIESSLKVKFPMDYVLCAKDNHGGNPDKQVYSFEGHEEAVFNSLLSLDHDSNEYLLKVYYDIEDRLEKGIYPFADDPFGNYICFDYRDKKSSHPEIVFWDHEVAFADNKNAVFPICKSFTELVNMLTNE